MLCTRPRIFSFERRTDMKKRLISVLLVFVLLLSVMTPLAGAITPTEMDDATALTLGQSTWANVPTAGAYAHLSYTPEDTCRYAFYSTGNMDTCGYLYDSTGAVHVRASGILLLLRRQRIIKRISASQPAGSALPAVCFPLWGKHGTDAKNKGFGRRFRSLCCS